MNLEKIFMSVFGTLLGGGWLFWLAAYFFGNPYWTWIANQTLFFIVGLIAVVFGIALAMTCFLHTLELVQKLIKKIRR